MRVLVITASKHGSTAEIGDALAADLLRRGIPADHVPADRVTSLGGYDAVVLGSAVYAGQWMRAARELAYVHRGALHTRPVWLFGSGRIAGKPAEEPLRIDELVGETGAVDHRMFGGRIVRSRLTLPERALVRAMRVREGDFRDWSSVDALAADVAARLVGERTFALAGTVGTPGT